VVVTAPPDRVPETRRLLEGAGVERLLRVVPGGDERQQSVRLGLEALTEASPDDIVLIHDGVRPFLSPERLDALHAAARPDGALLAIPCRDTVKQVEEGGVAATLDRSRLWLAQTPQAFPYALISEAHRLAAERGLFATDDAALIEARGGRPRVVEGSPENVKITTAEDLAMVRARIAQPSLHIGHGYDVHRLVSGRPLILGGVRLDHPLGLQGHSDADVLAHAVADACLGAAGLGDLGRHFPDTDPRWRGADSLKLLEEVGRLISGKRLRVTRVDATLVAERPKIAPHAALMEANLSRALGLVPGAVTVKATTTEGLGFEGREEGISAHAVALVGEN
jgi:2-C-methyl-D-erythritol 2,4-cyclodiphosphate synthase/2-C-methyl-D-erythritol 4-phosphate cytidylyltransferase